MESVRIRSFSGAYFPPTGLNTKRYSVTPRIEFGKKSECGKKRPDKLRIRTLFTQQQLIPQTSTCHNLLYWAAFNYVKFILLILAPKILVAILIIHYLIYSWFHCSKITLSILFSTSLTFILTVHYQLFVIFFWRLKVN